MKWRSFLLSWFYAALLCGAALSCPVTAFELPVSLGFLWIFCVLVTGLLSLLWHLPGRYATLSCATLAYAAALWRFREVILAGFSASLERVTDLYARAYPGWTAISLMRTPLDTDATLCFAAIAIPLAALLVWTLRYQTGAWLQILICAPWLGLCMVVVDCLPSPWALLTLLVAGLLLVLTQDARQQNAQIGLRLTAVLLIPAALLVALLAWLSPPAEYERADWPDALREELNEGITRLSGVEFGQNGAIQWQPAAAPELLWTAEHDEVDLSELGDRRSSGVTVMEVQANVTEHIYLRGASLTEYRRNSWFAASISAPLDPLELGQEAAHTVTIQTRSILPQMYVPYYPVEVPGVQINDEYYYNNDALQSYSVDYQSTPVDPGWITTSVGTGYRSLVYNVYCQLPESTADALLVIAEEAGLTALPAVQQPDAVADFVRRSARYSLSPEAMPWDADFPVWFLTEAEEGYCVHFATATATLLRAMGIPARYVTGFVADARAGRWVEVTDSDAHAWVEYWRDDIGWVPLESTPGGGRTFGSLIELPEETTPEPEVPDEPDSPEPETPDVPETPDTPDETDAPVVTQPQRSWAWLGWACLALAGLSALVGSRWLRLWRRQKQIRGSANERALILWRQLQRLARHSGSELPPQLEALAQKARFSQHALTTDELARFYEHAALLTERLRAEPGLWGRFRNRWIWADC